MTTRMVDALYPPTTAAELSTIYAQTGAKTLAVYLPKWGTPKVLDAPDPTAICKLAISLGWSVHLIGDPDHNALTSLELAGAAAFDVLVTMMLAFLGSIGADLAHPGACSFDLEESDFTANPGLCAELAGLFYQAGNGKGILPCQYGNPNLLAKVATLPDAQRPEYVWIAYYPGGGAWPASPQTGPVGVDGLWTGAGQRAWQWHGGIDIGGVNVDLSVVDWPCWSAAPPVAPTPIPTPTPTPPKAVQLMAGQPYLTPKGDTLTLS